MTKSWACRLAPTIDPHSAFVLQSPNFTCVSQLLCTYTIQSLSSTASMGKHRYNHSLRKQQQQPASANNFFPSQVQAQVGNHKEPLEGINVRGQAHKINQGGEGHRSREHARNNRRSKSPEQKNYSSESRPQHRNNSQSRVPLPSMTCISRHNTSQTQKVWEGKVSKPVSQPSTKRKRDNTADAADDRESPRSNKKAHTSSEDMTPTVHVSISRKFCRSSCEKD